MLTFQWPSLAVRIEGLKENTNKLQNGYPKLNEKMHFLSNTVDGRNPAPVGMVNIPLFTGFFIHPKWFAGFLPSTVRLFFFGISSLTAVTLHLQSRSSTE